MDAGLHGYYDVEYGRDYVPDLDLYNKQVGWNLGIPDFAITLAERVATQDLV